MSDPTASAAAGGGTDAVQRGLVRVNRKRLATTLANIVAVVVVFLGIPTAAWAALNPDFDLLVDRPDGTLCEHGDSYVDRRTQLRTVRQQARRELRVAQRSLRRVLEEGSTRGPAVGRAQATQRRAEAAVASVQRIPVSVPKDSRTIIKRGYDVNAWPRSFAFTVARPLRGQLAVSVRAAQFVPATDGAELSGKDLEVWAVLDARRSLTGRVFLCIDPSTRAEVHPGTYQGQVVFDDPRLEPLAVPVTLSLSYTEMHNVVLVGLGTCFLASLYVCFLRRDKNEPALRSPFTFLKEYWEFATDSIGGITIAAGFAAAATAFTAQYLNAEAWSGGFGAWLTYCGAVGTAFVAGGTAGRLAKNAYVKEQPSAGQDGKGQQD